MELYKNTINEVQFKKPTTDTTLTSVGWAKDGVSQGNLSIPTANSSGVYTVKLPYLTSEGVVDVTWTFNIPGQGALTRTDTFTAVTPYVSVALAREELEIPVTYTDEHIFRAERKARRVINRYCRQSFGAVTETHFVRGNNTAYIKLPKRLISVDEFISVTGAIPLVGYQIRNDGRSLVRVWDVSTDDVVQTHVIHDPYGTSNLIFKSGVTWSITGLWGWQTVPDVVSEATLLLIEQDLCQDAVYRERYIKTMTAADWRFEYDPRAYGGTGNAVADQILTDYVWDGSTVI